MLRRRILQLITAGLLTGAGFSQTSLSAQEDSSYLLRSEQTYRNESVCGLIRTDGHYHVERTLGDKSDISEGTLASSGFKELQDILDSNEVVQLRQDRITLHNPTGPAIYLFTARDRVGIDIWRSGTHQILVFPNDGVRQPFKHWLNPLLHLLDSMRKEKSTKLSEEGYRNNCLPPAPIELKSRGGRATAEPKPVEQPPASAGAQIAETRRETEAEKPVPLFILRMVTLSYEGARAKKACVVLYPDGQYRLEQFTQQYPWEPVSTEVFEGKVSSQERVEAEKLIQDPTLQGQQPEPPPEDFPFSVRESTVLTTLSGTRVRNLGFWKFDHVKGQHGAKLPDVETNGSESLKALRQWFKTTIEREKGKPEKDAVITDCVPNPTQRSIFRAKPQGGVQQ